MPAGKLVLGCFTLTALVLACAATPLGATSSGIQAAKQKAPKGAVVFERECAACHGKRGEGLSSAPAIMGAGALPTYARDPSTQGGATIQSDTQQQLQNKLRPPGEQTRQPFRTAADLYDYVSKWMPLPQARIGSLSPDEYWAVVNFMLTAHGSAVPAGGVTPENAANVSVAAP